MVHYDDPRLFAAQQPPPVCPKCGSHRTEVVGINDRGDVVLRCNACGERSTVSVNSMRYQPIETAMPVDTIANEIAAMRAISSALARLHDDEARERVLRWARDRFGALPTATVPTAPKTIDDPLAIPAIEPRRSAAPDRTLSMDGVESMFDAQHDEPEPTDPRDNVSISTMVRSFVADFQRLAGEWKEN